MKKALCLLGFLFATNAQATVIDFQDIWLPNAGIISADISDSDQYINSSSISSRGFQLSTVSSAGNWFALANLPAQFNGPSSTFLLLNNNTGWDNTSTTLTISSLDGSLFSLLGFDFSSWGLEESATKIQVTGQTASGPKTQTLSVDTSQRTFASTASAQFTDWNQLTSISFNSLTSSGGSYNWAIDNIRVNEHNVAEPASLALLGLGLASISLVARRRKKTD